MGMPAIFYSVTVLIVTKSCLLWGRAALLVSVRNTNRVAGGRDNMGKTSSLKTILEQIKLLQKIRKYAW